MMDHQLFLLINSRLHAPWLDFLMITLTQFSEWKWLFACLWILWMIKAKRRGRLMGVIGLGILLSVDALAHLGLKNWIDHPRPFWIVPDARVLVDTARLSINGFPSNHALNSMTLAVFAALLWKNRAGGALLIGAAVIVGFSRIYVGAHFPSEVLGGIGLGILFGWAGAAAVRRLSSHPWIAKNSASPSLPPSSSL